jgi:tellurite resistance protein TerC
MFRGSAREAKRLVVLIGGGTVLFVGGLMLLLPGPGLLVIFLGLSILATEFAWARAWLRRLRVTTKRAARRARHWRDKTKPPADRDPC